MLKKNLLGNLEKPSGGVYWGLAEQVARETITALVRHPQHPKTMKQIAEELGGKFKACSVEKWINKRNGISHLNICRIFETYLHNIMPAWMKKAKIKLLKRQEKDRGQIKFKGTDEIPEINRCPSALILDETDEEEKAAGSLGFPAILSPQPAPQKNLADFNAEDWDRFWRQAFKDITAFFNELGKAMQRAMERQSQVRIEMGQMDSKRVLKILKGIAEDGRPNQDIKILARETEAKNKDI